MRTATRLDELAAAADDVVISFADMPSSAVEIRDVTSLAPVEEDEALRRFGRHGFAILAVDMRDVPPRTLLELAESLNLGAAFIPPLYLKDGRSAPVVSRVSAAYNAESVDAGHPSFGKMAGQRLHCDGTLQEIGFVKTTLLLCESPAAEGGDTILFNASAAFASLVKEDPHAAVALATDGVLIRQANINGSSEMNVGPVFGVRDSVLVNNYSTTETDRWGTPEDVDGAALARGLDFLAAAATPGSGYFAELRLDAGEAIMFDNSRIAHGRTAYLDSADSRRCLYRSLHLQYPQAGPRSVADPAATEPS